MPTEAFPGNPGTIAIGRARRIYSQTVQASLLYNRVFEPELTHVIEAEAGTWLQISRASKLHTGNCRITSSAAPRGFVSPT